MFIATEYRIDFVSSSIFLSDRRQLDRSYRDRIAWLRALLKVVRGIIRDREVCARLKWLKETFFRSLHLCSISCSSLKERRKKNLIIKDRERFVRVWSGCKWTFEGNRFSVSYNILCRSLLRFKKNLSLLYVYYRGGLNKFVRVWSDTFVLIFYRFLIWFKKNEICGKWMENTNGNVHWC